MTTIETTTAPMGPAAAGAITITNPAWAPAIGLLDRVRELAPDIEAAAPEGERLRTMPPALVERLRSAGCFRLALDPQLGGIGVDPVTFVEVIEAISRADGSAGWTTVIGSSGWFLNYLEPAAGATFCGPDGSRIGSGAFAPTGTATPDGHGGFVIDGRWAFNSGCVHADWHFVGVLVMDGDRPALRPDGRVDHRFAFVSDEDVTVIDTWDTIGLRGTGSHDLVVEGVRVPAEHLAAPLIDDVSHASGPRAHIPFFAAMAVLMAGFPLGVGRRALDELEARATTSRSMAATDLAHDPFVQVAVGRAEAQLRSARAWMLELAGDLARRAERGAEVPEVVVAEIELAFKACFEAARAAATAAYDCSGSGVVREGDVIQRCLRDLLTASKHPAFGIDRWRSLARLSLGA